MYILQYQGISLASRLIKLVTWGIYSHTALANSAGFVCEAWEHGGVTHTTNPWENHTLGTKISIYKLKCTLEQETMIMDRAVSQLGHKYDWQALFGFLPILRNLWKNDSNKWFCSHFAAWACRQGGVPLFSQTAPLYKVSPSRITWSSKLKFCETVTNENEWTDFLEEYVHEN
jgi:uncharacterized protein YycO